MLKRQMYGRAGFDLQPRIPCPGRWPIMSAVVVTRDGGIPIVSHAYAGDRPDVTQFSTVLDELVTRYRLLVDSVESLTFAVRVDAQRSRPA